MKDNLVNQVIKCICVSKIDFERFHKKDFTDELQNLLGCYGEN